MTTNGIILRDRQAAQFVEASLFTVNVSLDGAKESHPRPAARREGLAQGCCVPSPDEEALAQVDRHPGPDRHQADRRAASTSGRCPIRELVAEPRRERDPVPALSDWGTTETNEPEIDDIDALREGGRAAGDGGDGFPILVPTGTSRTGCGHFGASASRRRAGTVPREHHVAAPFPSLRSTRTTCSAGSAHHPPHQDRRHSGELPHARRASATCANGSMRDIW